MRAMLNLSVAFLVMTVPAVAQTDSATGSPEAAASDTQEDTANAPPEFADFSVPDVPAMQLLGAGSSRVTRPATMRSVAASLASTLGPDGKLRESVALSWSPRGLFLPHLMLAEYRSNNIGQTIWRALRVGSDWSLATVMKKSDRDSIRLAAGVRLLLLDRGDPKLSEALYESIRLATRGDSDEDLGSWDSVATGADSLRAGPSAKVLNRLKELVSRHRSANWNALRLELGGGFRYMFEDGRLGPEHRRWDGYQVWMTCAGPLGSHAQWLLHERVGRDPAQGGGDQLAAARLHLGSASRGAALEVQHIWSRQGIDGDHGRGVALLAYEVQTGPGTWFEVGYGVEFGGADSARLLAMGNLRWTATEKERWARP